MGQLAMRVPSDRRRQHRAAVEPTRSRP